ncbi:hypothetical protein EMIHUDRAFT_116121 [Emiliania huxleyi CCMP1516]|uniref:Uncharacterized protein n=2 Tax=Emiliania huxleyi TaxID=2903 RepID=A0A0D3JKW0_EMIH1|nr:hypothetical protein EMIHUDRAFT_116121 [Emiliania huxleyi CCMP1516]EOD24145.1 hypothetical protein EMIHUDRAFT_116121 [Emiliania huxleyi CCMP1516]|eukprot:XP_005776574.1 hypothetical protein EMIHUDRAFT_116121 [Emiliania huxleyi CCMP1516]
MSTPSRRPLVVFIFYFGELPVWLPLTLQSMHVNPRVDFVVVGDAAPPAVLPPNVRFEQVSFSAIQTRLSVLVGDGSSVRYNDTFAGHYSKGNDMKPLAAELYPQHTAGHEWWAWSDLDVVFGDLLSWMDRATRNEHAACCRCIPRQSDGGRGAANFREQCAVRNATGQVGGCCNMPLRRNAKTGEMEVANVNLVNVYLHKKYCPCDHGERVNVVCPLYPNPWRKKAWGPFTAFRVEGGGASLFRRSPQWRAVVASGDYAHFDEWWGEYHYSRGWETMGDVLTRLAEVTGGVVMSKMKMRFAEAKTCTDYASGCSFCPCGAMRLRLTGSTLVVNEREVMLLHLAQSKAAWSESRVSLPQWEPPERGTAAARSWARGCFEVLNLGRLNATCAACSGAAPAFTAWDTPGAVEKATRLGRHRVQTKWRGHIVYSSSAADSMQLQARSCDSQGGGG